MFKRYLAVARLLNTGTHARRGCGRKAWTVNRCHHNSQQKIHVHIDLYMLEMHNHKVGTCGLKGKNWNLRNAVLEPQSIHRSTKNTVLVKLAMQTIF